MHALHVLALEEDRKCEDEVLAAYTSISSITRRDNCRKQPSSLLVPTWQPVVQDKNTVRAPVALAIVKLLRVLPEASESMHLTKALQNVANLLTDRLQSTRDGARNVLVDIMKELGPDYMQPVATVLSAALPARGFTAHVLGYTLHACLQVCITDSKRLTLKPIIACTNVFV